MMRLAVRRIAGAVAILAIGLHTAIWGMAAAQAFPVPSDPFSVICHSGADGTADSIPAEPGGTPLHFHPCDHCNLCSITTTAPEPLGATVAQFLPARLLQVLVPPLIRAADGIAVKSASARGPPVIA